MTRVSLSSPVNLARASNASNNRTRAKHTKVQDTPPQPQSSGNVVPFKHHLPIQDIPGYSSKNKALAYGWKELTPVLNVLSKVFHIKDHKPVPMFVWVKENARFCTEDAVPESSLIYDYIRSTEYEKQAFLQTCEKILVDAFLEAKEFIANGKEVQDGFEICGCEKEDFLMQVKGAFGIAVNYQLVDSLLKLIGNGDVSAVKNCKKFFKASFVHEMVHAIRDEASAEPDLAQEIATHAAEILSTGGDNPPEEEYCKQMMGSKKTESRYKQDISAALKVLQQKLLQTPSCPYKPKKPELKEINKALMSIPKNIKKRSLKKMAQEIVSTSGIDLLRIAAGVKVL